MASSIRSLRWVAGVLIIVVASGFALAPGVAESRFNKTLVSPPYKVAPEAKLLHQQLIVGDLHADSLLWGRNLLSRSSRGHLDIPRMQEGNIAIQAFTVVTKIPKRLNINRNTPDSDDITKLAVAELWPTRTWGSLLERALYQADRLNNFAKESNGEFVVLRSRENIHKFLERRQSDPKLVAGFLGIEGAHALEGKLENLDKLFDAGFRMMSPSHFFDTEIGGSAAGMQKIGLTPLGREWVKRMEAKEMIIDLAHASNATIRDVTAIAMRPLLVSHTGVKGTCNNNRNLSDDQLRAIARTGGLVGIGYWSTAVCGRDAAAIARAIRYTANLIGVDHIALGSDFDGAVTEPFDVSGMALITESLMKEGFTRDELAKVMGRIFGGESASRTRKVS